MRKAMALLAALAAVTSTGCIGNIRDTTTARTATEMLLVSTSAERAVKRWDVADLKDKKVFLDDSKFDSVDKSYVMSALRAHLARAGAVLVDAKGPDACDIVAELRNASLGIWNGDFVLGIPQLPVAAQGFPPVMLPPLYIFRRFSQQGWAKFQMWMYHPGTLRYMGRSGDLWGGAFYNQWWWFGIGPFDGSNDIYPDMDLGSFTDFEGNVPDAAEPQGGN